MHDRWVHGIAQAPHEVPDDFGPTGRVRADVAMEVAQIHDAVVATDPLLVQLEVFFGMALLQVH